MQADQSNHKTQKRVHFYMISIIVQASVSFAPYWPMSVCCFIWSLVFSCSFLAFICVRTFPISLLSLRCSLGS